MTYVDGFVFTVPKNKVAAYKRMATQGGKLWMKHGVLSYLECQGDDLHPNMIKLTFPKLVKLKSSETVWFSFITFKSKAHRDAVNAKVMSDPVMNDPKLKDKPMPFDMNRMSYGGFKTVVEF